ncbi:MAG: hypothetical protein IPJ74_16850 [Saprospiraceae bacterium]|nr:hypothetical protein [Saprospiraceae bacterium]
MHDTYPFWEWFKENHQPYLLYFEVDEKERRRLSAILLEQLHQHSKHLFFEIFEDMDSPDLIFSLTTHGKAEYFEIAEDLGDFAPYYLEGWRFENLIPPWYFYAWPVAYYYNNITLEIDKVWFKPIHHPGDPSILAFTIYLKFYKKRHHNLPYLKRAVKELLFKYLGEEVFTLDVRYFDIAQLPSRPEKKGLKLIDSLPTYIDWHKTKKIKYSEN